MRGLNRFLKKKLQVISSNGESGEYFYQVWHGYMPNIESLLIIFGGLGLFSDAPWPWIIIATLGFLSALVRIVFFPLYTIRLRIVNPGQIIWSPRLVYFLRGGS